MNGALTFGSQFVGKPGNYIFKTIPTPWTLKWSTDGNGNATGYKNTIAYQVGEDIPGLSGDLVSFDISANSGYRFSGIDVSGYGQTIGRNYQFEQGDGSAKILFKERTIPSSGVIYFTQFNDIVQSSKYYTGYYSSYYLSAYDNPIDDNWYSGYPDDNSANDTFVPNFIITADCSSTANFSAYTSYPITSVNGTMPSSYIDENYMIIKNDNDSFIVAYSPYSYSSDYSISYWYAHKSAYVHQGGGLYYINAIVRPYGIFNIDTFEGIVLGWKEAGGATENSFGLGSASPVSCYNGAYTGIEKHGAVGGPSFEYIKYIKFPVTPDKEWHYYTTEVRTNNVISYYRDGIKYADVESWDGIRWGHRYNVYYGSRMYFIDTEDQFGKVYPASGTMAELYVREGIGSGDIIPTEPLF